MLSKKVFYQINQRRNKMNTRDVEGNLAIIKENTPHEWTKPDGSKSYIYSIGIKLDNNDEWHNISSFDSQAKCKEVLNKINGGTFVVRDGVTLTEEEYKPGKWVIKAITMLNQVKTEIVQTNEELGQVIGKVNGDKITPTNNENNIEKQCCLKCASMLGGIQSKEGCLKVAQWFYSKLQEKWLE